MAHSVNTKLLFSEVLRECLKQGTDVVAQQLLEIQSIKEQDSETEQNTNHVQMDDVEMNDSESTPNEYHSNEEKESAMSCDSLQSEIVHEVSSEAPSAPNRREIDISLHVQSMIKDNKINCNFPSSGANVHNTNEKKIMFGDHLKVQYKRYLPSTFQSAVLSHIEWQRKLVGHRMGLIIMATAMGKTILAIFDIEKELSDIECTIGIDYALQRDNSANTLDTFICPCDVHRHVRMVPQRLERITYSTYLSRTIKSDKYKAKSTMITPFRLVFIVHTKAIRNSAYFKFKQHFQSIYNSLPNRYFIRVEPNTKLQDIETGRFIFVLFQSFDRIKHKILSTVTHVIIDEVHHLLADTWLAVHKCIISPNICPSLQYYLGMTATLSHRTDISGDKLKRLFSNIVYINFPWTVAKQLGFFPTVEYLEALPTLAQGRDSKTYAHYLNEFKNSLNGKHDNHSNQLHLKTRHLYSRSLNRFIYNLENSLKTLKIKNDKDIKHTLTPEYIVKILLQYQTMRLITNQEIKKRILIFANNANDASETAALCNVNGLKAGAIHYKVAANKCDDILSKFRSGKLNVLVNVNVVNEGYDLQSVDCVVMARITSSEIIFVQQLGRGLRKDPSNPNKQICILDLALNLRRRWKVLQDIISDQQIIDYIFNFWCVSNFVGFRINQ